MLRSPSSDSVGMHVMLHPSKRVYYATPNKHALMIQLYDTFVQESGYFRGVFMDPVLRDDGSYEVECGPDACGCTYPSLP